MTKRIHRPNLPGAWVWFCRLTAAQDIHLHRVSIAEAAELAVSRLETQKQARAPLNPELVRVAALLVELLGVLAADEPAAGPFVERLWARERARLLGERYAARSLVFSRPPDRDGEPQPPPDPEPLAGPEPDPNWITITMGQLIEMCESFAREARESRSRPETTEAKSR
jgi:hypothetical protein